MRQKVPFRKRRESGSAYVEMALGILPYFAIVLGIIEFSMALFLDATFQNAAREGVRYAITYNTTYNGTTYGSQTDAVRAVVENFSMGFLNSSNGSTYIQVNYYLPNNLSTPATASSLPQIMPDGTVVNYVNQTGNIVEVSIVNFPWNWMVPLPGFMPAGGLRMSTSASDVLQGLPVGMSTPPAP